jgi:hypothetical protein
MPPRRQDPVEEADGDDAFGIAVSERDDLADLLESVIRQYLTEAAIPAVSDTYEEVFDRQVPFHA